MSWLEAWTTPLRRGAGDDVSITTSTDTEVEAFFLVRSAHLDIAGELVASPKGLGVRIKACESRVWRGLRCNTDNDILWCCGYERDLLAAAAS